MFIFCNLASQKGNHQINQDTSPDNLDLLLSKLAQDDRDALSTLYHVTNKTLYAYILSLTGNFADAEDILQDTYLKIRAGAHLYQSQGKPLAWIFTIAKNLTYMKFRATANHQSVPLLDQDILINEAPNYDIEDVLILKEALHILSEVERQIVFLYAISGLKHREIAATLQMPLATVLSKYTRSLNKLKKHLRQQGMSL